MTEEEMVGWHHQLNGHRFGWTLGVGDGQGGLVCYGSWGHKESDMTEWLNWTELMATPLKPKSLALFLASLFFTAHIQSVSNSCKFCFQTIQNLTITTYTILVQVTITSLGLLVVYLLSCVWLICNPIDCKPPGSSVHGISQLRILEWVAISFSRGSSWPRDWTHVYCISRQILYHLGAREVPWIT